VDRHGGRREEGLLVGGGVGAQPLQGLLACHRREGELRGGSVSVLLLFGDGDGGIRNRGSLYDFAVRGFYFFMLRRVGFCGFCQITSFSEGLMPFFPSLF
jgi:hypothetical protein